MNLLLHGIGNEAGLVELPVATKDALVGKHGEYDMVLANPPFGKRAASRLLAKAASNRKNR
jgi:type I restriction enzyme M protein